MTATTLNAEQARDVLTAAEQCWHDRDLEALVAVVDPNVRIRFNGQPEIRGRDEARAWFAARLATQLDYRLKKTLRALDGPLIVSSWVGRWRVGATGEFYRGYGIELLTIQDGLVQEWDAVMHSRPENETTEEA